MTDGTGGSFIDDGDLTDISGLIGDAIKEIFENYSTVVLALAGGDAPTHDNRPRMASYRFHLP